MEQNEQSKKQVSPKEKFHTLCAVFLGLSVGAVLGLIAYTQNWLG